MNFVCRKSKMASGRLPLMVGIGTDPFDNVQMYEMIHYLLTLCFLTRVKPRICNKEIPGLLASTFDKFIGDVMKYKEQYNGSFLKYLKLVPLMPMYKLYHTFDYPLTIEDLCAKIYDLDADNSEKEPFTPELIMHTLQGCNTVTADETFSYVPYKEDYVDFKKESLKQEDTPFADLSLFEEIGLDNVAAAIKRAVPEALICSSTQLNGEFKLSFLDFCDILTNLAGRYIKEMEEFLQQTVKEEEEEDKQEVVSEGFSKPTPVPTRSSIKTNSTTSQLFKQEMFPTSLLPVKKHVRDMVMLNRLDKYI